MKHGKHENTIFLESHYKSVKSMLTQFTEHHHRKQTRQVLIGAGLLTMVALVAAIGVSRRNSIAPTAPESQPLAGACTTSYIIASPTPSPTPTPTPTRTPSPTPSPTATPTSAPTGSAILQSLTKFGTEQIFQTSANYPQSIPAGNDRLILVGLSYNTRYSIGTKQASTVSCFSNGTTPFSLPFLIVRLDSYLDVNATSAYQTEIWAARVTSDSGVPAEFLSSAFNCELNVRASSQHGMTSLFVTTATIPGVNLEDPFHTGRNYLGDLSNNYNFTGAGAGNGYNEPPTLSPLDTSVTLPTAQMSTGDPLVGFFYATSRGIVSPVNVLSPLAGIREELNFTYPFYGEVDKTRLFVGTKVPSSASDRVVGAHHTNAKLWVGSAVSVNKL